MVSKAPYQAPELSSSFTPPPARFRDVISLSSAAKFPAERGRYALYLHLGCPWSHRTNIVYQLKRLQSIVALSVVSIHRDGSNGWTYDGTSKSDAIDPVEGFKNFKELFLKADPSYQGRYAVPVLWDRKTKDIVSNDSVGIIRSLYTAFDAFLEPGLREMNRPGGGLRPQALAKDIDELGDRIERDINLGTYKIGFTQSQADYSVAMEALFKLFGELDERLGDSRFLFGDHITEPDIRLFTTAIRFDIAYYTVFMCNWKMIRYDFPNLHRWLRELYYEVHEETKGAFKSTTHFEIFMEGFSAAKGLTIISWGPSVPIMPLDVCE